MPGLQSKLPEGWERSETTSGIPYYINHETEKTQWDHPEMVQLLQDVSALNNIKYAAYRTAMKLRAIQKKTQLYLVEIPILSTTLDEEGIQEGYVEKTLTVTDASRIITALFINQNGDRQDFINIPIASDLTLNLILNIYDPDRTGFIQALSLKIGLSILCAAKLQDKYRYLFRQMCNSRGVMDKRRLKLLLQECLQIPKYIYENAIFSGTSVEPAVKNCFETSCSNMNLVTLDEFMDWMVAEPQTIVWLPTLHRLAVSETVKHEAKCNICKVYPLVGFRYRCLKCFNYDICQECFWTGRVSKSHKIGHPTQEYCIASSQKEDIKDFAKVMRNKVSKKKKNPSKGRFISIANEDASPDSDEEDSVDGPSKSTKINTDTHGRLETYASRLADYEDSEEPYSRETTPKPRTSIVDEQDMIEHYATSYDLEPVEWPRRTAHPVTDEELNQDQRDELEDLINRLENDNRSLRDEIDHIHQLQVEGPDSALALVPDFLDDADAAERLRQRKERLLAREEILEAHNRHLQIQLNRLRMLLHQDVTSPSFKPEESSPAKPSPPYPSAGRPVSPTVPHQPTPLPKGVVIPNQVTPVQSRGDISQLYSLDQVATPVRGVEVPPLRQFTPSTVTQTIGAPTNSLSTTHPPWSQAPGAPSSSWTITHTPANHVPTSVIRTGPAPVLGGAVPKASYLNPFAPPPDLGNVNSSSTTYDEEELDRIVERMTSAFPLDVESDISMEMHNDLFLAASMVGEAMQSMVSAVARQRGTGQTFSDSPGSYAQDITDDETPSLFSQGYEADDKWRRRELSVENHPNLKVFEP